MLVTNGALSETYKLVNIAEDLYSAAARSVRTGNRKRLLDETSDANEPLPSHYDTESKEPVSKRSHWSEVTCMIREVQRLREAQNEQARLVVVSNIIHAKIVKEATTEKKVTALARQMVATSRTDEAVTQAARTTIRQKEAIKETPTLRWSQRLANKHTQQQ